MRKPLIVAGMATIMALPFLLIVPVIPFGMGLITGLALGLGLRIVQRLRRVYRIVMVFGPPGRGAGAAPP